MADRNRTSLPLFHLEDLSHFDRCHLIVRFDHASKGGGDIDLANRLRDEVITQGISAEVTTPRKLKNVSPRDCLILFNLDRPFDALSALAKVPKETRCFLYTLHHPQAGVAKYLRHATGLRGKIAQLSGWAPEKYEALIDVAKGVRNGEPHRVLSALRHKETVNKILARCHLLVVAEEELSEIELIHGPAPLGASILPHPPLCATKRADLPFRSVVVPGRIEPRKNQLAGLRALADAGVQERGVKVIVVGGSGSDKNYFQRTINECKRTGCIYMSSLPKDNFFSLLSSASLVVNPSFFEVTSLVDLYVVERGIPLITTKHAYYNEAPLLNQVDPNSWFENPAVIEAALDRLL